MISRNHRGWRVGETHGRAKLSDKEVRQIRAEYIPYVVGYATLAKKHGAGISTIRDICTYRTRPLL